MEINTSNSSSPNATTPTADSNLNIVLNSDILIPLLVLMVVRSNVQNLQSSFFYIQKFTFEHDVVSGEFGFAISSLEGVIGYITDNVDELAAICQNNNLIWNLTKSGNVVDLKNLLDADPKSATDILKIRNWDGDCLVLIAVRANQFELVEYCKIII